MESSFDYLRAHAAELGSRILETYPPLQSTKDPIAPAVASLLRKALPAQGLAITGTAKYLRQAKAARIVAECGAGKTYMALGAIHVLADGRPSTTLVMCPYWLDLGNNASSGQYVLGQPLNAANRRSAARLRTVAELYPEIADTEAGEDPLPSCSAAEALERQEPFINQVLATSALAMLARLLRYGAITHHGAFYNAQTGRMRALPADPDCGKGYGGAIAEIHRSAEEAERMSRIQVPMKKSTSDPGWLSKQR